MSMTAGADIPEPNKRELSLPTERLASASPHLNLTSIVGNDRSLPRENRALYRTALSQDFQIVQGPVADVSQVRTRRLPAQGFESPANNTVNARLRQFIQRNHSEANLTTLRPGPDRMALTRQLLRTLHVARAASDSSRRHTVAGRAPAEVASEKVSAERKAQQQAKIADVAKRARSVAALIKSNPDAVAKLAAIIDSAQGEHLPSAFAGAIIEAANTKAALDRSTSRPGPDRPDRQNLPNLANLPDQTDQADNQLVAGTAAHLAERSPAFASRLGQAILQQAELVPQSDETNFETTRQAGQELAQILKEPNNRVLLESVVASALKEPQSPTNVIIFQEIARVEPGIVERNPQIASVIQSDSDNRVVPAVQSAPREIRVASLDPGIVYSDYVAPQSAYVPEAKTVDFRSYTFSPEITTRIDDARFVINNYDGSQMVQTPERPPISVQSALQNAVRAEIYSNPTISIEQIRDNLTTKLGINESSKLAIEIQNTGTERALVFVPTSQLLQERPDVAPPVSSSFTEFNIDSTRSDVRRLERFIADLNSTSEATVASRFADVARNSTSTLNTVLAFRQVIMSIARSSGLSGVELAQKIKDELNLGLGGSGLSVEADADTLILNTVSEGAGDDGKTPLVKVDMYEAPAGTLTTEQIERIKTELVAAVYDPFKLAMLEQKLIQNGVMQSDIDELKTRAMENPQIEPVVTDQSSIARIREDMRGLVSVDEFERQTAAEDLVRNNIGLVSGENGAVSFSIAREDSTTRVSVWVPGEEPDAEPTSLEMYSFSPDGQSNTSHPRLDELTTSMSGLDWANMKLDIIKDNGRAVSVGAITTQDNDEINIEVHETVSPEMMISEFDSPQSIRLIDPNFNPYEYVDPSAVKMPQTLDDLNFEQVEEEQYQDQNIEEEQYPEEEQEQSEDWQEEVPQELPQEIPQEIMDETQGQEAAGEQDVVPALQDLFSNDMRKRATAASMLYQNGVEVFVETNLGLFQMTVDQGINPIAGREIFTVRLQDTRSGEQKPIAEMYVENGEFARFTPPAPPSVNLQGARVIYRVQGQEFSIQAEQLLGR